VSSAKTGRRLLLKSPLITHSRANLKRAFVLLSNVNEELSTTEVNTCQRERIYLGTK